LEINTSVGFDFRHWKFNVFDVTENRLTTISIDRVIKNTSSEMFDKSTLNTYLLDFKTARKISVMNDYLNSKVRYRGIGSTYSPKMITEDRLIDTFDALTFVKNTTESTLLNK
jgi:erythromycin esterase-like protein